MGDQGIGLSSVNLVDSEAVNGTSNKQTKEEEAYQAEITYGIDDVPPWYLCIFMALQHYLTMIGAIVSIPFILTPALCMREDDPARGQIISTMIFVTGIVTFIQVTFGCRLPIVQGGTISFLAPTLAILNLPQWKCTAQDVLDTMSEVNTLLPIVQGGTISFLVPTLAILNLPQWKCPAQEVLDVMSEVNRTEVWQVRMRELSGAIAVSSLVQVFIGYFGVMGILLKFVTPLTIVPTVSLVGLSLFQNAAEAAATQWAISGCTIVMLTVFSQCLTEVRVPGLSYKRGEGLRIVWFQMFKLFPVLLTIVIMWAVCGILTWRDILPFGHPARTDVKIAILEDSDWFRIPYPGQWGMPTVSASGVLGMLAGVLACTVESISYYPTVAKMCGAPPPPVHAINRGIGTEGLGTFLAGIWGSGNGTNTFGENVGAIGVTKVGSRRVIQYACILMLLQGVISKFGAVFIIIPEPVVGGIFCVMFGMITAFGLSALQYVELNSSRNLYIIGFSMFFSLVLPKWMVANPGAIQTGNEILDSVLTVLLSTSILVGGLLGCFLDNVIPGTPKERGLIAWSEQMKLSTKEENTSTEKSTYDFPIGMDLVRSCTWLSYLPFMPTYRSGQWCC